MRVWVEGWGTMDVPNFCLNLGPNGKCCAVPVKDHDRAGGHVWLLEENPAWWPELNALIRAKKAAI